MPSRSSVLGWLAMGERDEGGRLQVPRQTAGYETEKYENQWRLHTPGWQSFVDQ